MDRIFAAGRPYRARDFLLTDLVGLRGKWVMHAEAASDRMKGVRAGTAKRNGKTGDLETRGIEPRASRMRSGRSTI